MTDWVNGGKGWGVNAPVFSSNFDFIFGGETYEYPDVWITVQQWEPTEYETGRNCIAHYTPDQDPDGWYALDYGGDYYNEGMNCKEEALHEKRIQCFKAAELLYLHAASKGNPYGHLCLGYVYSYDRCEGKYWDGIENTDTEDDPSHTLPHEVKACVHYRVAAEADIAEACYKLGDMLRDGRGCDPDPTKAFQLFKRAYELGGNERPVIWGSAALRLGQAYEEGEGCEQNFNEACAWYERAVTGLDIAVRGGDSWYSGALRHANAGLKRVQQELSGTY